MVTSKTCIFFFGFLVSEYAASCGMALLQAFFIGASTTSQDSSVFVNYVPCYSHMVPDDDECLAKDVGKKQKVKAKAKAKAKLKPGNCLSPVGFLASLVSEQKVIT